MYLLGLLQNLWQSMGLQPKLSCSSILPECTFATRKEVSTVIDAAACWTPAAVELAVWVVFTAVVVPEVTAVQARQLGVACNRSSKTAACFCASMTTISMAYVCKDAII